MKLIIAVFPFVKAISRAANPLLLKALASAPLLMSNINNEKNKPCVEIPCGLVGGGLQ